MGIVSLSHAQVKDWAVRGLVLSDLGVKSRKRRRHISLSIFFPVKFHFQKRLWKLPRGSSRISFPLRIREEEKNAVPYLVAGRPVRSDWKIHGHQQDDGTNTRNNKTTTKKQKMTR